MSANVYRIIKGYRGVPGQVSDGVRRYKLRAVCDDKSLLPVAVLLPGRCADGCTSSAPCFWLRRPAPATRSGYWWASHAESRISCKNTDVLLIWLQVTTASPPPTSSLLSSSSSKGVYSVYTHTQTHT